jgi:tetratricopeptide (TPR) repeat protein
MPSPFLELIISEFPNSANAYDSMGEAYLQAKDSTKALQFYEKSLQMNPDNFFAEDVIQKIKFPNIKPLTAKEKFSKVYSTKRLSSRFRPIGSKTIRLFTLMHLNLFRKTIFKKY